MPHSFSNQQIADMFAEITAALIVQNDDRFRIRAYDNATTVFSQLQEPIEYFWKQKLLMTIPGIGSIFAQKLDELFTTGKIKEFEAIKASLPEGMFELIKVEGIGPKNAFKLAKVFNLNNRQTANQQLLEIAKQNKISELEGFGAKSQAQMIDNITRLLSAGGNHRIPLYRADQIVAEIATYVGQIPRIKEFSPLGSHRRRKETVGDIDIGIATHEPEIVSNELVQIPKITKILAKGPGTVRIIWGEGIDVDFKLVNPQEWGSLLQHFTGSKEHNVALREMAVKKGMSMSEHGMKINGKWQRFTSEVEFYKSIGLDWIPPELRENQGEIEAAIRHRLPTLITKKDIKGDLHTHTNYGWINSHDAGLSSADQLADTAIELGYEYIGLGDHNPSLSSYSVEEQIKQVKKRSEFIEQQKSSYEKRVKKRTIKIFNTLEIDIKPDGTLALPGDAVDLLDYAVVSIHSSFKQSSEQMTNRIIKALSHPKAKIMGHPTTRQIGKRDPISADWDQIFAFCAKNHKALEINASPDRLDLSDEMVRRAISKGVMLAINTDSHQQNSLYGIQPGVDVARRGWATIKNIINSWSLPQITAWLRLH